jgi:hypothetical protein
MKMTMSNQNGGEVSNNMKLAMIFLNYIYNKMDDEYVINLAGNSFLGKNSS